MKIIADIRTVTREVNTRRFVDCHPSASSGEPLQRNNTQFIVLNYQEAPAVGKFKATLPPSAMFDCSSTSSMLNGDL